MNIRASTKVYPCTSLILRRSFVNIILTSRLGLLVPAVFLALGSLTTASPSLVYDSTLVVTGAGFGNIPRHLTVQGRGNDTSISGCIGLAGGSLTFGDCIP